MPAYFVRLGRMVRSAVSQRRIGSPVALRAFFHLSPDHGRLMPLLGEALNTASGWFASPPARLYALGGVREGQVTVLLEYAGGETALVSVGVLQDPTPSADLLLIGNRGTLRYEGRSEPGEPGAVDARLVGAVERSLASRTPVEIR